MWMHQAIYNRYPSIDAVIHSHSRVVLPFANTGVPLVPQLHLDGVLVDQVPVFDIAEYHHPKETHDFLVNLPHLGAALAERHWQTLSPLLRTTIVWLWDKLDLSRIGLGLSFK